MNINLSIEVHDVVRLKAPLAYLSSPMYVVKIINEHQVLCECFKGIEQVETTLKFDIYDLEKIDFDA